MKKITIYLVLMFALPVFLHAQYLGGIGRGDISLASPYNPILISAQWNQYPTGVPYSLFAVDFYESGSGLIGIAVGQGGTVLRTANAGVTWTLVSNSVPPVNPTIWLNDVKFVTADEVYAAGMGGVIIKSIDGGQNWTEIRGYDDPIHTIRGIAYDASTDKVHFVGYAGAYFEYKRSTSAWTHRTDILWTMHSIAFSTKVESDGRGIIAGTDGLVWNTDNHGVNWVSRNSGRYDYLNDVVFANDEVAFICGNNGTILQTNNHGNAWSVKNSPTSEHLRSIDLKLTASPYPDDIILTVCGDNGKIYTTKNRIASWVPATISGETRHFYGVCLRSSTLGTVVGEVGTGAGNVGAMYNTNGNGAVGVVQTGTNVPKKFALNQNFPNPFNPTTKISFALAKAGPVMLTVFDMSGKEVATLVNTALTAGNFEYTFDGSKLSSGVYFYRIITNDFVESKKMTLLK